MGRQLSEAPWGSAVTHTHTLPLSINLKSGSDENAWQRLDLKGLVMKPWASKKRDYHLELTGVRIFVSSSFLSFMLCFGWLARSATGIFEESCLVVYMASC